MMAAAEPSAKTDDETIWSGELLGRMCRLHSSVHDDEDDGVGLRGAEPLGGTQTGKGGGAADEAEVVALGRAGQAEVADDPEVGPGAKHPVHETVTTCVTCGCRRSRPRPAPPAPPGERGRAPAGCTRRCAAPVPGERSAP